MSVDESLRILIVEDEVLIALELESMLEEAGHTAVGIASSGAEGIALGRELEPDLALVDVNLGDGPTGVDVARALTDCEATTIVFMTASGRRLPEDLAGAAGFIGKPYSGRMVRSALRFIADRRSGRAEGVVPPDGLTLSPRLRGAQSLKRTA